MTYPNDIADAARAAARVTAGVTPDQLAGPTPCPDYDTRTLVNHLVAYTGVGMELRARREPHPEGLDTRDFTAEPDWQAAYAAQLERSVAAWSEPAAWEGEVNGMPAEGMAGMLFLELCLHGWDLARATGQDFTVADATAQRLLTGVREYAQMYRDYKGFGEPAEIPEGAGALETAVALSGRDPYWAA
ncbi:TIGR03086 family metal-binding protein [Streptomyces sp. NPDC021224]|uniref:TIGR03086 family metal-binding protein n=1 Tax=unclassified Streptomyces TaxID=2593676 RepID=UPI0037B1732E